MSGQITEEIFRGYEVEEAKNEITTLGIEKERLMLRFSPL